jgi:hypothetical protein
MRGVYVETTIVIDLLSDGTIAKSDREDAVQPGDAKKSDV